MAADLSVRDLFTIQAWLPKILALTMLFSSQMISFALSQAASNSTSGGRTTRPHILLMLIDELGTGDVPWEDHLIVAPTIGALDAKKRTGLATL